MLTSKQEYTLGDLVYIPKHDFGFFNLSVNMFLNFVRTFGDIPIKNLHYQELHSLIANFAISPTPEIMIVSDETFLKVLTNAAALSLNGPGVNFFDLARLIELMDTNENIKNNPDVIKFKEEATEFWLKLSAERVANNRLGKSSLG